MPMCKRFFFNLKIAMLDFRNYVQYERALYRKTYTQMNHSHHTVIRHFSRRDKRIREVIPVPVSQWKETTFVLLPIPIA